jgi:hypothetical protein
MRKSMLAAVFALSCAAMPASGQNCAGFTDVFTTDNFCTAVTWMKARGITLGCAAGQYCPQAPVTRASMALFMYRLAHRDDIVFVAPTGGDYASIQAAIDAAAASLPASPQHSILVKIAPGVYNEQVTLKDNVDLEGSGFGATWITGNGSGGTMIAGANCEVRNLTVLNTHDGTVPDHAMAVHQPDTAAGLTLFTHVSLQADGPTDNIAVAINGGAMTIEEGRVGAGASGVATGVAAAIVASGAGASVRVRNSIVGAAPATTRYSGYVDGGAEMQIENTQLGGDTFGTPACFNTYNPAFVAKPCL